MSLQTKFISCILALFDIVFKKQYRICKPKNQYDGIILFVEFFQV